MAKGPPPDNAHVRVSNFVCGNYYAHEQPRRGSGLAFVPLFPDQHFDSGGRPVVVVTGSGLVTSLGAGKTDNWKRLTAGNSGIHAITRFATDCLKTKIAGTIDYLTTEPVSAPDMTERLAERAGVGSRTNATGARTTKPAGSTVKAMSLVAPE